MTESEPETVEEKTFSPRELEAAIQEALAKRDEDSGIPTFDFKEVGVSLEREYIALAASLDLPFYVTLQECARDVYRVVLSDQPLKDELRHRPLEQHSFVWAGKNKKGMMADTILLTHDKYYTDVPLGPELLGIKQRKLRIVEMHYLATSDLFFDRLIDDISVKCNLKTPEDRDLDMVTRLLDARVCEKVMGVNRILTSEKQKDKKDSEWTEKTSDLRLYTKLEKYLEDIESTGKVIKPGRFGISLIPSSFKDIVKYVVLFIGLYFIIGLILSFFGLVIPGISGGGGSGGGGPPNEPEPYTGPEGALSIVLAIVGWLM